MESDEARRGKEALSGGHLCHVCGYQYPNAHPSAKLRRSHRKNCRSKASTSPPPPGAAAEEEDAGAPGVEAVRECNAGDGILLVLDAEGAEAEGDGASEANGGAASRGSANEDGDSVEHKQNAEHASPNGIGVEVIGSECGQTGLTNCSNIYMEIANEGNETIANPLLACANGSRNEVDKHCSELELLAVGHKAEREDSFDEYQDASPFLHQSDSEDGTAVAHSSTYCTKVIKSLNSASLQPSVAAHEIPAKTNVLHKDHLSIEPNVTGFSANSKVEKEIECYLETTTPGLAEPAVSLKLENPDGNSDETSSYCELTGDNASSLKKCSPFISDPDSHSTCFRNIEGFRQDNLDALHIMAEASPKPQVVGSDNVESGTEINSSNTIVLTGNDLKLIHTENTSECTPQNWAIEHDVQLCAEDSCQETSASSVADYQNDLAVTNSDGIRNSIAEGISVKGSVLDSSCEERAEPENLDQLVDIVEENHSVEEPNGLEEVCNKEFNPDVPTKGQVSACQEYAALLMDQVSCSKNPFNLDDTRSDDLFELDTDSYHLETSKEVESKLHVDIKSVMVDQPTVANQISIDVEEKMQIEDTSTEEMTAAHSIDNVEVTMQPDDTSTEEMTAIHSIDNVEEKKQIDVIGAEEMNATSNTSSIEKEQAEYIGAELNPVQHFDDVEEKKQTEGTGAKEVNAVQSRVNVEEKNQAEDTDANTSTVSAENIGEKNETEDAGVERTIVECTADNAEHRKQANNASTEMNPAHHAGTTETSSLQTTDNVEEKQQPENTAGEEANNQNGEIAATATRSKSERVHVPLKVLLAEASVETKEKKTSAKERVLSFRRRASSKDDTSGSPKAGSDGQYWDSPARLPHDNVDKRPKGRKQPWMPFICCHSVH